MGKKSAIEQKFVPDVGQHLIEEVVEEIQPIICQECGLEIPAGLESCPNCGCPIEVDDSREIKSEAP